MVSASSTRPPSTHESTDKSIQNWLEEMWVRLADDRRTRGGVVRGLACVVLNLMDNSFDRGVRREPGIDLNIVGGPARRVRCADADLCSAVRVRQGWYYGPASRGARVGTASTYCGDRGVRHRHAPGRRASLRRVMQSR